MANEKAPRLVFFFNSDDDDNSNNNRGSSSAIPTLIFPRLQLECKRKKAETQRKIIAVIERNFLNKSGFFHVNSFLEMIIAEILCLLYIFSPLFSASL